MTNSVSNPVIQGHADTDVRGKLTQDLVSKSVDFCMSAFAEVSPMQGKAVMQKLGGLKAEPNPQKEMMTLTDDELAILRTVRARQMLRIEEGFNIELYKTDVIEGFVPRLVRGKLGLNKVTTERDLEV